MSKAADLFRTKGFDGISLENTRKEIGVSPFKLSTWFGRREGILSAVFNATWAHMNGKLLAKLYGEMLFRQVVEAGKSIRSSPPRPEASSSPSGKGWRTRSISPRTGPAGWRLGSTCRRFPKS
ncbi:MAG: TetR/AcrR family transcriptional regulator [Candidatus Methylomirabilales bacterium]